MSPVPAGGGAKAKPTTDQCHNHAHTARRHHWGANMKCAGAFVLRGGRNM
eukprot:CAMPEP_0182598676 /NCGR_PEP_ID=MMETSP1324-20130603/88735_1 /TAXON_ID=236786 /ORGANISM="Florenciella sp., Strain RCC1587" /LENGTH=49 /DNA_ID= /DNA_START= /DNA_END= /DNA_ORIENTATION=